MTEEDGGHKGYNKEKKKFLAAFEAVFTQVLQETLQRNNLPTEWSNMVADKFGEAPEKKNDEKKKE